MTGKREYDQQLWFIRLAKNPRHLWDKEAAPDDRDAFDLSLYHRNTSSAQRSYISVSEFTNRKL